MVYTHLKTCEGITEDDFRLAIATKEQTQAFLGHIEDISKPATGVGKILFFFARLALRNSELQGTANYVYEDLVLQVAQSRHNPTLFEVRYMNDVGGTYEQIFKVTVWCVFDELLDTARDTKNISPFSCVEARENFLFLRATAEQIQTSIPPPAYIDADARYQELLEAGMLSPDAIPSPVQLIPTIPAPEDEDPAEILAGAVVRTGSKPLSDLLLDAKRAGKPITSLLTSEKPITQKKVETPYELSHATVGEILPPARKEFDSLAEEAKALAQQPPSIPSGPIPPEDSVRSRQSEVIGKLSLVKARPGDINPRGEAKPKANSPLRSRPETVRPPGIEEEDNDETGVDVDLPLINRKRGE